MMFRLYFKPIVADHSLKSARHLRLGSAFTITNYLIPYKPFFLRKMLRVKE